ncbi:MAG: hypothetical protein QUV06_00760 [Cyanobium sp. CZS 48M]|nr:hypothetical protein [Cyanobium sp. CZS48M]
MTPQDTNPQSSLDHLLADQLGASPPCAIGTMNSAPLWNCCPSPCRPLIPLPSDCSITTLIRLGLGLQLQQTRQQLALIQKHLDAPRALTAVTRRLPLEASNSSLLANGEVMVLTTKL